MNIIYDPLNMLPSTVTKHDIQKTVGILLNWATYPSKDISITMLEMSQFPIEPLKGGYIAEDGTYTYPEDPPLFPIVKIENLNQTVYLYEYSLVSIVSKDTQEIYRMD